MKPIRPKRCEVCGKIIRQNNNSGFCSHHYNRSREKLQRFKKKLSLKNSKQTI